MWNEICQAVKGFYPYEWSADALPGRNAISTRCAHWAGWKEMLL